MKIELSSNILGKMLELTNIRPVGAQLFQPDRRTNGRTDKDDDANSHFSQCCQLAKHNDD